jgi:Uma2 family endonuclease
MSNLAYKEEVRTELLNGVEVAMSPRPVVNHLEASGNIHQIFKNYLVGKKCRVFYEMDVHLTPKDIVVPDIAVICDNDIIKYDGAYGAPDLVVEVLSPSTAKYDRGYKKDLYERCGVKEYWIVDTRNYSIDVYLLENGKYTLDNLYTIFPDYVIEKMTEKEKSEIAYDFKTSLFPDLVINIEEVFYNVVNNL